MLHAHIADMRSLIGMKNNIYNHVCIPCLLRWIWALNIISDAFEATMQRSVDEIHAHDDQGLNIFNELSESSYPHYLIYKISLGVVGDQDFYRYIGFGA